MVSSFFASPTDLITKAFKQEKEAILSGEWNVEMPISHFMSQEDALRIMRAEPEELLEEVRNDSTVQAFVAFMDTGTEDVD